MLTALFILGAILALAVLALAATIAFSSPKALPPMASVANSFLGVDFSALPDKQFYRAADGAKLAYRLYPGDSGRIAVLIHGSSGTTASMHPLARAIAARGATVYALAMRGHDGGSSRGRSGDIDYIGQLDDDLTDFIKTLGPRTPKQKRTLLGFSSGGGFALRFAGGPNGALFDRLVLVAPQFPHFAPTVRPQAGGWVSVAIPRIVALSILTRLGITQFNGLAVLAMSIDPARGAAARLTPVYSYRMLENFSASNDYLGDIKRVRGPVSLFVGAEDEIFRAEQFAPLLKPVRPDLTVTVLPCIDHMGMTVKAAAVETIAAAMN